MAEKGAETMVELVKRRFLLWKDVVRAGDFVRGSVVVLRRISRLRPRSAESRNICKEVQGYFKNNAQRMRYGRFRRQGLFIGSGAVEAGCKHIVGARLKQSGMRRSLSGLRSILQLRLALRNGDWPLAQAA